MEREGGGAEEGQGQGVELGQGQQHRQAAEKGQEGSLPDGAWGQRQGVAGGERQELVWGMLIQFDLAPPLISIRFGPEWRTYQLQSQDKGWWHPVVVEAVVVVVEVAHGRPVLNGSGGKKQSELQL